MSRHAQAVDTLRWGDALQVGPLAALPGGALAMGQSKQIAKAQWRWPLLWAVRFTIEPQVGAGETANITVRYQVTIGSGQNSADVFFQYVLAPADGVYSPATDLQYLPAGDIQVQASVSAVFTSGAASNFRIGAFLAPLTEPHATTHIFEELVEREGDGKRWMQDYGQPSPDAPGTSIAFPVNPDPLRYGRR